MAIFCSFAISNNVDTFQTDINFFINVVSCSKGGLPQRMIVVNGIKFEM